jgi:hypothetical protein
MSPARFATAVLLVAAVLVDASGPVGAQQSAQPLLQAPMIVGAPAARLPGLNAFGPGINADAEGRPYVFMTPLGTPIGSVYLNVYGPGVGADSIGWPVYALLLR